MSSEKTNPYHGIERKSKKKLLVGLAGQQNAGKSTIFNMLTGANQHIANYPGVTVDKKSGGYQDGGMHVEILDLPGTYSLTSFSLEERVTRDFLLFDKPDIVVNVLDASTLKRSLFLTFQLLEMGFPVVLALNMMDVADRRGLKIDTEKLQKILGVDIIPTVGRKKKGKDQLKTAIKQLSVKGSLSSPLLIEYGDLESEIRELQEKLIEYDEISRNYPVRWFASKLIEGDSEAQRLLRKHVKDPSAILNKIESKRVDFETKNQIGTSDYMVACREKLANIIITQCVVDANTGKSTLTEKIDRVVLNRFFAPFFLLATVYLIYELSIVRGYELTQYTWPFLAKFRDIAANILPDAGLINDPYIRSMGLWMVDSANTLLNYVPIFLILFALIAILEDSGYMARIAFILDKIFNSYGLHGQSTLPFILGGIFAGGCAVPGIMATKGIPDERARMATILTTPFMNCMAKIPLYTLLVNIYFVAHKAWVMLFISTITVIIALAIAKLLTSTILKNLETAPFVMELPNYHLPTLHGVLQRSLERTWIYIKKVGSIVLAVSVFVFTLLQFPGLSDDRGAFYLKEGQNAVSGFYQKIGETNPYLHRVKEDKLVHLLNYYDDYKQASLNAKGKEQKQAIIDKFRKKQSDLFIFIEPGTDADAKKINTGIRNLSSERKTLRRKMKEERIVNSFLGNIGRSLEPVTQFAGFDWKINVALLSSFAARESSVATLGALFQQGADENQTLEERMGQEGISKGFTPLHALAIMLFFLLYPPCLATTIMVKVQTQSYKWMFFSILFPTALGLLVASLTFTIGSYTGLSGIQMMFAFYVAALAITVAIGFMKKNPADLPVTAETALTEEK